MKTQLPPQTLIENRLAELTQHASSEHAELFEAARYSLLCSGKRLRPRLLLAVLEDHHIPLEQGLDVACALEMIHTYSLIHDDLPCMDDDDLRRGKPSLHKAFGEAEAVLTGDYLLTYAFEVIAKCDFLSSITKLSLIQLLSQRIGSEGMIGGQWMDISYEGHFIAPSILEQLQAKKTAALISASIEMGGMISEVCVDKQKTLKEVGIKLGIAFQLIDDLLDVKGEEATIGKPVGSDAKKEKASSLTVYSINEIEKKIELLTDEIHQKLASLTPPCTALQLLCKASLRQI